MSIQVSYWIPQGNIYPMLFLLFIDDIFSILKYSKISLLANEDNIYKTLKQWLMLLY